jgi:hypothetical protein
LSYGQIGGDEVLLLVDGGDVALLDLFADDGDTVRVLLALNRKSCQLSGDDDRCGGWTYDAFGLSLALLKGVLVLELGSHIDRVEVCCLEVVYV